MCATRNVKAIKVSKQLMEVRLSRRRAYETQRNELHRERETVLTRRPERGRAQGHNFLNHVTILISGKHSAYVTVMLWKPVEETTAFPLHLLGLPCFIIVKRLMNHIMLS